MTAPLFAACLWVLASALVAVLPMRAQFAPGIALLIAAPLLIGWIGAVHGLWIALAMLAAALSMFRNPVIHFARRALGALTERPPADKVHR